MEYPIVLQANPPTHRHLSAIWPELPVDGFRSSLDRLLRIIENPVYLFRRVWFEQILMYIQANGLLCISKAIICADDHHTHIGFSFPKLFQKAETILPGQPDIQKHDVYSILPEKIIGLFHTSGKKQLASRRMPADKDAQSFTVFGSSSIIRILRFIFSSYLCNHRKRRT